MKRLKTFMSRHGKKAFIIYLGWCVVKGVAFLLLGMKLFS